MKIAMISTPFVPVPPAGYGGTELIVHELTEGLVQRGHDVTLFATGDSHTAGELRYLYMKAQWPLTRMTDLNHVSWAMKHVQTGGFDLVHLHSAEGLACARLTPGIPTFYTLHHVREEMLSAYYRFFPEIHFIAISGDQRSREVSLPRIRTIWHGLSPDRFEWRPKPANHVAFIGRFARIKGPHVAIDAAGRAGVPIRVGGEVHTVDQDFADREMTHRLALPHVTFLGPLDVQAKVRLLRDARALLFPIDWDEPFGLVLIEAMLSGCPPVAFARGSVPEVVEDGVTGFVVRDEDEMVELLRAGSALDTFDRHGCRERAMMRFGAERMVEAHERYYQRVLAPPAGAQLEDPEPLWPLTRRGRVLPDAPGEP